MFQTDKKPLPSRCWGDGENPVSGAFGSNHSDRLMLKEGVCSPGCGTHPALQEVVDAVVPSASTLRASWAPVGSGWQPNG